MDIEQPVPQNQPKLQQPQEQTHNSTVFLLPGQTLPQSPQQPQYNSSTFQPTQSGLVALYAGFPSVSTKTNVTTLVRFPIQYMPVKNDLVIGIIRIKTGQTFIVDIGAPLDANLGGLEFDGVTKRNKPNLKIGATVFCRVVEYSKYTGGKISCINKGFSNKKTNELGQLKQGYLLWIPQYKHQQIQTKLLQKLGKITKFQVAFGKNGRIWLNCAKVQNLMLISNLFKLFSENVDQQRINALISMIQ